MEITYRRITEARNVLGLPETADMETIRSNYRRLLDKWHPDHCDAEPETCHAMTVRIIDAYQLLMEYCARYRFSFTEETVRRHIPLERRCFDRFRDDPLWGGSSRSE